MENYDIVEPVVVEPVVQDPANKYSKVYRIRAKPLLATHKKTMCVLMGFLDNLYLSGVIDADKLGHLAYTPGKQCYHELIIKFGDSIRSDDGTIDRRALGSIVFNDKSSSNIYFKHCKFFV